jgi:cytochrome P450/NADPH-cytochrome P450 reductase
MGHIAQETIAVLEQYRPDEEVEILKWCTNLTFETIGRIGFGYSFDLMDRDKPNHPFINAMGYALGNSIVRFSQPQFMKRLPTEANRTWARSIKLMHDIVDEVVADRKKSPDAKNSEKDLLGFMLNAVDEHNLGLSDQNIRDQIVTFLIAGHDTTANTLAWTLYELARNPDIQAKVLQEIANAGITHDKLPTVEQISSLKYLGRVLKETLRCYSPLRILTKYCKKDCVVPGGYRIKEGQLVAISTLNMHMNPNVYDDPSRYDPDRWTPEEEQKRSRYAWLPFSTGPRSCIGMVK